MSDLLEQRSVIVTTSRSRHGAGIARELSRSGVRVLLVVVQPSSTERAAVDEDVEDAGTVVQLRTGDLEGFGTAVAQFTQDGQPVDFLVLAEEEVDDRGFLDADPAAWREQLNLNMLSGLCTLRAVLPGMLASGRGHIVVLGEDLRRGEDGAGTFCEATKHGRVGLCHALRSEVEPAGITVTMVTPEIGMSASESVAVSEALSNAVVHALRGPTAGYRFTHIGIRQAPYPSHRESRN
jgi:NAD(P)-dependent dehydrogenase (short-subunit alcohol dehydrogenase family)